MTTEPTTKASADVGKYHSYLNEIAEIVESGSVYPSEVPGKVRELVVGLRAEIATLQQALSVAERHDTDVRFEAEADVRAELAEKAGA